jgi:hypothetical protein
VIGNLSHDVLEPVVYSDDQVLLLFGQSEEGLAPVREAARRAGCRVADEVSISDGPKRLDRQIAMDAALVVAEAPSRELDLLLARLDAEARRGWLKTLIVAPASMIDSVTGAEFHECVDHLFDPSPEELVIGLALARPRQMSELHDVTRRNGTAVLQQLSEEAARIASILASMTSEGATEEALNADPVEGSAVDANFVRSIIRVRRMRDQYFRGGIFADPAFDMLLDLMAARLEGNRVAVSSLCIAAAVPATTALRWIKALSERGLFVRSADPQDGRRVYIELSDEAARAMGSYLAAVQRAGVMGV